VSLSGVWVGVGVCAERSVVTVRGDLELLDVPAVTRVLSALLAVPPGVVLLDLRAVPYVDCFAARSLARLGRQARRAGGDMVLVAAQPLVARLLDIIGLEDAFTVQASLAETVGPLADFAEAG
jgi:anti-sigma B factor antagonist